MIPSNGDRLCGWGGVTVLGLEWLRIHHRRPGTTGFGLAVCWGSPPPCLTTRARWIGGGFFRVLSLHDATARNPVDPAWAQFFLFGRSSWDRFGCREARGDAIPLGALPLCALCSGRPRLLPLNATAIVGNVVAPQLQHLSCCFEIAHVPDGCASPKATYLGACARSSGSVCIAAALLGLCMSPP
jgi:hypothetical protein